MRKVCSVCFVILLLAMDMSCSEEVKPTPYTYTKIFTGNNSKTWKIQFFEQTLNGNVTDTFTVGCASDDQMTFVANGENAFKVTTGSSKCYSPAEASEIDDFWSYNSASATLTFILPVFDPVNPIPFIVHQADKSTMTLEVFFSATSGDYESYRIHMTSTHEN